MRLRVFPEHNPREEMKGSIRVWREREYLLVTEEQVSFNKNRVAWMRIWREEKKKRRDNISLSLTQVMADLGFFSGKESVIYIEFYEGETANQLSGAHAETQ